MNPASPLPAVRPQEQLLIDLVPELAAGRLLCNTAGRAQFALEYARNNPQATATCWFLDLYQCEQARAAAGETSTNLQLVCAADFPSAEVDLAALALHKQGDGELTREMLQQAHERLAIGGRIVAAIDQPSDQWLHELLKKQYDKVTRRPSETGAVYLATKKSPLKKLKHYDCEFEFRDAGRTLKLLSRPGVFSHRELDGGARALLNVMQIDPGLRVLDIGCGSGAVALAAAAREAGVRVHAIDSNPRAVECVLAGAERNDLKASINAALDCDGRTVAENAFDLVLANPPYFSNFRLAELFVQIASKALVEDGYLLVVTKTPKWYEEHLPAHGYREINTLPERGYVVVTAMKA
jgi:16S rRNA (guanine1207-N2)-methyltransferase